MRPHMFALPPPPRLFCPACGTAECVMPCAACGSDIMDPAHFSFTDPPGFSPGPDLYAVSRDALRPN